MKKFLKDIFLFTLLFLFISTLLSFGMDKLFAGKHYSHTKHNWVLALKNKKFDYAAIGSSRVLNTLNVQLIDSVTGKSGINIATSGSSYADNYMLLKKFIDNNNFIQYLIINIDEYCFDTKHHYSYPFADYEYMPFFYEKDVNAIFKEYSKNYYAWKFVPYMRYAEFSDKYKLQNLFILRHSISAFEQSKGYEVLTSDNKKFKVSESSLNYDKLDMHYLKKIILLCQQHNIKPILITSPELQDLFPFQQNRKQIYNMIHNFIDSTNLPYIYFETIGDFNNKAYFVDYTHTNSTGSDYYSVQLAKTLQNLYFK